MSLSYSVKEAVKGFSKARVSAAITIFTVFFLLLLLAVFFIFYVNANRLIEVLNAQYDIQVYLSNALTDSEIEILQARVRKMEPVESVEYISKKKAAAEFRKEFGEDIFALLDENPLPASFVISLKNAVKNRDEITRFINRLRAEEGIDEVVYQYGALNALVRFSRNLNIISIILFVLVFCGSFFMVSNTLRLIIIARKNIIDSMKLVGATHSFIRRPFIIGGMLQGLIGGLAADLVLWLGFKAASWQWPGIITLPQILFPLLLVTGVLFGILGSLFAVKRYL
ncbi:MAG: ABC transporter permease [Calditrichaeota bacterium]|nr:MAG: ABC transporter permease [Calditrichota bacterium]